MTAATTLCLCGEPLRVNGNFCVQCGREIRQSCPVCFDERRLIATRDVHASPWCENRGEALSACIRCGRWFPADCRQCPDPGCRGSVGFTWPVVTGASMTAAGVASPWVWPASWDRNNPSYSPPRMDAWSSDAPVHCAFAAHGRLYVWAETSIVIPAGPTGGPLSAPGETQGAAWRCWLGLDGRPDPQVPSASRVSIVGGGAIFATVTGYLAAGLAPGRSDDFIPLEIGSPLLQAAADGWWVGWSRQSGRASLWTGPIPASWRGLACGEIDDVPAEAAPRKGSPLSLQSGLATWIGEDSAIWQLDCRCRDLHRLTEPFLDAQAVFGDRNGLYTVRDGSDGLWIGPVGGKDAGAMRVMSGGDGPLRDLFGSGEMLAVVGQAVTAVDTRTGETTRGGRYTGRWIAGALTEAQSGAADPEPRLLMLTEEAGLANLVALRLASGVPEPIWSAPKIRPLGLIPAGEDLYVVLETGIVRLQEVRS